MKRLYLDLDGVMADFDGSFPAVFGLDHRDMADDEMWLKINGHPSFFRDLSPLDGALEFFRSIEHLNPIILTACPKSNYAHVAGQKVEWVRQHLSPHVTVLPVLGGTSKPLFMHAKGDVLIDDFRRNTEAWVAAGGVAILHREFEGTHTALVKEFPIVEGALPLISDTTLDAMCEVVARAAGEDFSSLDRFTQRTLRNTQKAALRAYLAVSYPNAYGAHVFAATTEDGA